MKRGRPKKIIQIEPVIKTETKPNNNYLAGFGHGNQVPKPSGRKTEKEK